MPGHTNLSSVSSVVPHFHLNPVQFLQFLCPYQSVFLIANSKIQPFHQKLLEQVTLCCLKRLLTTHHILSNHRFLDESESSTCNRKRNTTLVVKMQSITIDINVEHFLQNSSELGIKAFFRTRNKRKRCQIWLFQMCIPRY